MSLVFPKAVLAELSIHACHQQQLLLLARLLTTSFLADVVENRRDVLFHRRQQLRRGNTMIDVENLNRRKFALMPFEVFDPPALRYSIHLHSNIYEGFHIELPPTHKTESEKTNALARLIFANTEALGLTIAHVPVSNDSK